jgi:hypothetical protein
MIAPDEIAPAGGEFSEGQRRAKAKLRRDLGGRIAGTRRRFARQRRRRRRLGRRGPVCGLVRPVQSEAEPRFAAGTWPGRMRPRVCGRLLPGRRRRRAARDPSDPPRRGPAERRRCGGRTLSCDLDERVSSPPRVDREASVERFRHWGHRPRHGFFPGPWPRRGVHRRVARGHWATHQPSAWRPRRRRSPC